jgi:hypothetical protein
VFTAANLDQGLELAARNYCSSEIELLPAENRAVLSRLFQWYGVDFGSNNREVLTHLATYLV